MKVLFLTRSTLFSQPGGDTLQVEQTAKYLNQLDCEVEIGLSSCHHDFQSYDLIHFFNLIRPADARKALKSGLPIVVSSIYHDYSEYDKLHRGTTAKLLTKFFGNFGIEYLKTFARWANGSDKFPGVAYILSGQKKSMRKVLKQTDYLISTSHQELQKIEEDLEMLPPSKKINLGSEHMGEATFNTERSGVLCAARIEGPKNQLKLIRALQDTDVALHLTGNTATNQSAYYKQCKKAAGQNVHFHGRISPADLKNLYAKRKVHALISYYETTGLSTLEALKMGCQVVITDRGAQKEVFENHAFFCNPDDTESITEAVLKALKSNEDHTDWVKKNFSWEKAAREILDIYQMVTDKSKT